MDNGIIRKIYRKKDIDSIQKKIDMLGKDKKKFNSVIFLNTRMISTILLLIILLIIKVKYYIIPFAVILYYNLFYYYFITKPLKLRERKLNNEALTFFEILTLTLESGKNLENSLEITCYNINSELSKEFKRSLVEMKFGKSLTEVLDSLKLRIPSETINNIILNIREANLFGNSIVDIMNNQIDYLRERQILEIKSQINKIPNKISIISVIFIIPLILLIILGPFIMNLL